MRSDREFEARPTCSPATFIDLHSIVLLFAAAAMMPQIFRHSNIVIMEGIFNNCYLNYGFSKFSTTIIVDACPILKIFPWIIEFTGRSFLKTQWSAEINFFTRR